MTSPGKHRDESSAAAERYGKHSQAHARGLSALELLRRVVGRGDPIRLAWRDSDVNEVVNDRLEFPTAVLPVVRSSVEQGEDNGTTEPTRATQQARQWFGPGGMVRWPLAG